MTRAGLSQVKNFREVGMYLAVGLIGLCVDSAAFFLLVGEGVSPLLAQWAAASLGAVHNSLWHHYAVFDHGKKLKHTFTPNVAISLSTVAVSGPLLQTLNSATGSLFLSKMIVLGGTTFATYFLRKFLVFGKEVA